VKILIEMILMYFTIGESNIIKRVNKKELIKIGGNQIFELGEA
tara:strand:- start:763 stop:891 length:129 start_codon:yes stop_codon:yes gene_type:complete